MATTLLFEWQPYESGEPQHCFAPTILPEHAYDRDRIGAVGIKFLRVPGRKRTFKAWAAGRWAYRGSAEGARRWCENEIRRCCWSPVEFNDAQQVAP